MPATHSLAWRPLHRNKAAELLSTPRVSLSPLSLRRYLTKGQEAYGNFRNRAKASTNLPARGRGFPFGGAGRGWGDGMTTHFSILPTASGPPLPEPPGNS